MKIKRIIAAAAAVMLIPSLSAMAESENMIANSEFDEALVASDWNFAETGCWYSVNGTIGESVGDHTNAGSAKNGGLYQRVTLEATKTYTLEMDVYVSGTVNAPAIGIYGVNAYNENGTGDFVFGVTPTGSVGSLDETIDFTKTGEWQHLSGKYTPYKDGTHFVSLWNDSASDYVYIDNVTLTGEERKAEAIDSSSYTAESIWDANSGNPIMPGYIGDPFTFVDDDGTFYVYGTTDGYGSTPGDIMAPGPFCVWYSSDMVNWQCETFRYEDGTFPKKSEVLWAPSVTKAANGKYYMAYIWRSFNCYLAEADSPLGPWHDVNNGEVVAENMFDTDIVTIDGDTYVVTVTTANTVSIGKFKEDMSGLDENGLQAVFSNSNVFEAPGLFERDGKYYLTFANGTLGNGTYRVEYAMSDSLMSGYTYKGIILEKSGDIHTTGHNNCFNVGDDWYICYHRKIINGNYNYARQAAVEKMSFNSDGSIVVMTPSVNGARPNLTSSITEENLAWNGVSMSASSYGYESGLGEFAHIPMYAADRNNGTLWVAGGTDDEEWLMMDLGEVKNVGRVETFFEFHTHAYQYKIEYSTDGESWSVFSDKTANESLVSPQIDSVSEPVEARYLKITFNAGGVELKSMSKVYLGELYDESNIDYEEVSRTVPVGVFEMNVYENTIRTHTDDDSIVAMDEVVYEVNESFKHTDAKGFTYSFDVAEDESVTPIFYLRNEENGYKKLAEGVTISGGSVNLGLIIYNIPARLGNVSAGIGFAVGTSSDDEDEPEETTENNVDLIESQMKNGNNGISINKFNVSGSDFSF